MLVTKYMDVNEYAGLFDNTCTSVSYKVDVNEYAGLFDNTCTSVSYKGYRCK